MCLSWFLLRYFSFFRYLPFTSTLLLVLRSHPFCSYCCHSIIQLSAVWPQAAVECKLLSTGLPKLNYGVHLYWYCHQRGALCVGRALQEVKVFGVIDPLNHGTAYRCSMGAVPAVDYCCDYLLPTFAVKYCCQSCLEIIDVKYSCLFLRPNTDACMWCWMHFLPSAMNSKSQTLSWMSAQNAVCRLSLHIIAYQAWYVAALPACCEFITCKIVQMNTNIFRPLDYRLVSYALLFGIGRYVETYHKRQGSLPQRK